MQFATERQRTAGILPKQYVCHFELVIVTFHAASMTGQWMYSSKRQCETGGGDRSNPIVGTVARLAAVIDWARKAEIGPLSDCGHHRTVGTIRKLAHWRETGGGDRSCRETGGGDRLGLES